MSFYRTIGKRIIDVIASILLLLLCLPILIVIATLVVMTSGLPIIFKQERLGFAGRRFNIYKFRTMTVTPSNVDHRVGDEERLTKFGKFLRTSSLDELPQLFNIIRGDMSFVGPRPLVPRYFPYFRDSERLRFNVKPGITGLAQISGRNNLPWSLRFELDQEYVSQISFTADLKILFRTFIQVIRGVDIQPTTSTSSILDLDVERKDSQLLNLKLNIERLASAIPEGCLTDILGLFEDMHNEIYPSKEFTNSYFVALVDKLQMNLIKGSAIFFLALCEEVPVGFCWCYQISVINQERLHVAYLFVDKDYRDWGIARLLLKAASIEAKERKCASLELNVQSYNKKAISFYSRNGFSEETVKLKKTLP